MALNISIIIGLLGFLPLLIVIWKRRRMNRLITKGDIVTGTVLEVYKRTGYKGSIYYQAIIEYPVFNQAPMQGSYTFAGKKALDVFYRGRRLDVYYDKDKPKRFIPKDAPKSNIALALTLVFAAGYIVLAYCLYGFLRDQRL